MAVDLVETLHQRGVEKLEVFFSQLLRWRRLNRENLKPYQRFVEGWEIPGLLDDPALHLRLLVDSSFPFTPPRVAVYPAPDVMTWPHLEEKGILCLLEEGVATTTENIGALARDLLLQAQSLVNACLRGEGFEQFEDEFLSYWQRWPKRSMYFASLCNPDGPTRWVYSTNCNGCTFVADTDDALKKWVKNHYGEKARTIDKIPFIVLTRPLRPSEYPRTIYALLSVVAHEEESNRLVQEYLLLVASVGKKKILLGFHGRNGFGFAGLVLPQNDDNCTVRKSRGPRTPMEKLRNGFRDKIPAEILLQRYFRVPLLGALVQRVDGQWVHGRGHNPETFSLMKKTVVCVGTGSLGSGVVELLAKMGVGKIVLVDPELLHPENASRHSLGVRPIPTDKTKELAKNLRNRFPHLEFEPYAHRWEYVYERTPYVFLSADLIISTVGIWSVEGPLNAVAMSSIGFPSIIFGWLEVHAAAGHAIVGACLNCMVDDKGHPKLPVTTWQEEGTYQRVAMCGGMFQPYGAVELTHVQALVADLVVDILLDRVKGAVHRTWIGHKKLLSAGGGKWNQDWTDLYGDPHDGGKMLSVRFCHDLSCTVCKELR